MSDQPSPIISTHHLTKTFRTRSGNITALDDVSLDVPKGTVFGLLGHNGAGKTTLVNLLTTLNRPTSGSATVAGFDLSSQDADIRRRIGLTGQYASVDENLTGMSNLVLIARLLGATKNQAQQRARELIGTFELDEAAHRKAGSYSGGMRRRLDLAASLVGSPEVIFLDEPTTGLDPASRIDLWGIIERLVSEGTTVLLTTQYLEEADRLADRIAVLSAGAVVAEGTPAELKATAGHRTLSVRVDPPHTTAEAAAALRAGGVEPRGEIGDGPGELTASANATAELVRAIRLLDQAGIELAEVAVHQPSLDDVFLTIAGRGAAA